MKKVLFIDRDGTIIEETADEQIDSFEKLEFYPKVFQYLSRIAEQTDYELVMITNQDGLGTEIFPEDSFWPTHNKIIAMLEAEGIKFSEVFIDKTFPYENAPTRKPGTGMLTKYMDGSYDLANSYVIGDRLTDVELARNLGCKAIWINTNTDLGNAELSNTLDELRSVIALETDSWKEIYELALANARVGVIERVTKETAITIALDLNGTGESDISTGIKFFDHMLDQLARHGGVDLNISVKGDLEVDEHHTIEDTAIALGESFSQALGDKRGIERYGFSLPMDDCLAQVAIDFGGRNWLEWDAEFNREMIGEMPTEMFFHFFKSFSDGAKCNLNIKAEGTNEHHKIEAIFKAFAKAIKMAIKLDAGNMTLPTTKGVL